MRRKNGFTLVEMVVVLAIVAILLSLAIPQYRRMIENSKADDALATVQLVATANRSFSLDNAMFASGLISDGACAGFTCQCPGASCSASACNLLACNYIDGSRFDSKPYQYFAAGGVAGSDPCGLGASGTFYACAKRRQGAPPGTDSPPYNAWGYTADQKGVTAWPAADPPPSPPS